ncbi:B3 domain-containing protein At3g19184-like [Chenopodium quinoa]|uniref:B3 domain-containing protein At3g19184-like n=1 Tax=Chenopodium quinoa TaxID=63459 RepID=UPI000B7782ED|nr:B3 domain-containing protein At3g19184-like [Chenopodium quinoa]
MVTKTAAAASYEEKRKKRLEENKKRMMQLNIPQLSQALKPSPAVRLKRVKPKPKPKPDTLLVNAPLRRSTRMADKPPPDYHEFILVGGRRLPLGRNLYSQINASTQIRLYAIQRAQELELRLGSQHPTFVKALLQAHVVGNLNLPTAFCKTHLLNYDGMLTLVDEDGKKCQTKFHLRYNGLGSGWRGFSIDHHLVDGDVLVFQLIEPTTLKFFNGYPYHGGSFEQSYQCYPASYIEKPQIESGDKIIMPPSALDRLASLHIDYPMLFELRNDGANRVSHCGVLEFIAEEVTIYMPYSCSTQMSSLFFLTCKLSE